MRLWLVSDDTTGYRSIQYIVCVNENAPSARVYILQRAINKRLKDMKISEG